MTAKVYIYPIPEQQLRKQRNYIDFRLVYIPGYPYISYDISLRSTVTKIHIQLPILRFFLGDSKFNLCLLDPNNPTDNSCKVHPGSNPGSPSFARFPGYETGVYSTNTLLPRSMSECSMGRRLSTLPYIPDICAPEVSKRLRRVRSFGGKLQDIAVHWPPVHLMVKTRNLLDDAFDCSNIVTVHLNRDGM